MTRPFRIRDPVHGFVRLTDEEARVIDTPVFQRLRGIKQLALANLVYPGALHTRFDHSIGVCHVAGMMAEALELDDDDNRLVRLAALLHDLGHGPFSHVSEDALERFAQRASLGALQQKEKIHELITAQLIERDKDLLSVLSPTVCRNIVHLLGEGYGPPVLRNIVSGHLDADKQDYLLRDSRFCGVPYGVFDLHQLHRSFILGGPQEQEELWIDRDGVHAVEQYVLAKYYMTTMVYRHQVRLITDQMITRAIVLGIEHDKIEELRTLFSHDGSEGFVRDYVAWDDGRFLQVFAGNGAPAGSCRELLQRLTRRELLKKIYSHRIRDFAEASVREVASKLSKPEMDAPRRELEHKIADVVANETGSDVDPNFVILFAFDIRSVRASSRDDEGSIMVGPPPNPRPFVEESTLFKSIDERYSDASVEVYAPVTWKTPTERKKLREHLRGSIGALIEDLCKKEQNPECGQ